MPPSLRRRSCVTLAQTRVLPAADAGVCSFPAWCCRRTGLRLLRRRARRAVPGSSNIRQDEFDHIRALPTAELDVDRIISAAPMLPAASRNCRSLISFATQRAAISSATCSSAWIGQLKADSNAGFILGERGSLVRKIRSPIGRLENATIQDNGPLSHAVAEPTARHYPIRPRGHAGSRTSPATRVQLGARLWLVGESARIETVRKQVSASETLAAP